VDEKLLITESNCNCNFVFFFLATTTRPFEFCDKDLSGRVVITDDEDGIVFILNGGDLYTGVDGFAPNGVGAFLDMGGHAADELLLAGVFATDFVSNGVGALLDMGGNAEDGLLLAGAFAT